MEEIEFSEFAAHVDPATGVMRQPVKNMLPVEFYHNAVDNKDHIRVYVSKNSIPDWVVDESHKQRWPDQWRAYETESDQFAGQTRLEDVPWVDGVVVAKLRTAGIRTLEGLAEANDNTISHLGIRDDRFRDRAIVEVTERETAKQAATIQAENEQLNKRIAALEAAAKK